MIFIDLNQTITKMNTMQSADGKENMKLTVINYVSLV